MTYEVHVYICPTQAHLTSAVAEARAAGQSNVTGRESVTLVGFSAPIPVFKRYPRSIVNALMNDATLIDPQIEDVVVEFPTVEGPGGGVYTKPVLLITTIVNA